MGLKGKLHKQPTGEKERKMCLAGVRSIEFSRTMKERKKKKKEERKKNERKMAKIDSLNVVSPRETGYRLER